MKQVISIIIVSFLFALNSSAQQSTDTLKLQRVNDTTVLRFLPKIDVKEKRKPMTRRQRRRYNRLVHYVKTTLPYAKLAAKLVQEVNDTIAYIPDKREQKRFIKKREKELFKEFEKPVRKMTIRQGIILMKLIDRECQQTSYDLVQFYRGGFQAFFWQGIARLFGHNLKVGYNAYGEDFMIESIVQQIEAGKL